MRLSALAALIVLLAPVQARAFDWFGLHSGMSPAQVRAAVPAGSSLRLTGDFGFIEKNGQAVATVTFCRGRAVALSRTIDAQSDWFALADRMIKQYGRPTVEPAADPWAGAKAGAPTGLELSWRSGRNRYALTAYPAQPGPQAKVLASLSVTDLGPVNACAPRRDRLRARVRPVRRIRLVRHARRTKSRLPPIGGATLNLTPAAAVVPRQPAPAAEPADDPPREAGPASGGRGAADPASVRGRLLRFIGELKARIGANEGPGAG